MFFVEIHFVGTIIVGTVFASMIELKIKNCNITLTEKQQKYQHYHEKKLTNKNILEMKNYSFLIYDK